jgi:hypothetical protein
VLNTQFEMVGESGLQAHPPLSLCGSIDFLCRKFLLCLLCARYLFQPFAGFHDSPRALAQFPNERGVMLLDGLDRVAEQLRDIVG